LTPSRPRSSSDTASSRLFPRSLAERLSGILNIRSLQPVLQSSALSWRLRTLKLSSGFFTPSPIQKSWTIAIKICMSSASVPLVRSTIRTQVSELHVYPVLRNGFALLLTLIVQIENLNCDLCLSNITNVRLKHEVFQKKSGSLYKQH
jgi:hypothetical protein